MICEDVLVVCEYYSDGDQQYQLSVSSFSDLTEADIDSCAVNGSDNRPPHPFRSRAPQVMALKWEHPVPVYVAVVT